jgi:hypothetical protein
MPLPLLPASSRRTPAASPSLQLQVPPRDPTALEAFIFLIPCA